MDAQLAEQQKNHPNNVVKASNRNIIGNIFIADPMFPIFDRASGSLRLFSYIKILRKWAITLPSWQGGGSAPSLRGNSASAGG